MKKSFIVDGQVVQMSFEQAFKQFERMIHFIIHKRTNTMFDYEELYQESLIVFWKAYESYDVKKEIAFATYAGKAIELRMMAYWRNNHNKINRTESLNAEITYKDDGSNLTLMDTLRADVSDVDIKIDMEDALSKANSANVKIMQAYISGFSQTELSKLIGIKQSLISRRISRVRKEIHSILKMGMEKDYASAN